MKKAARAAKIAKRKAIKEEELGKELDKEVEDEE